MLLLAGCSGSSSPSPTAAPVASSNAAVPATPDDSPTPDQSGAAGSTPSAEPSAGPSAGTSATSGPETAATPAPAAAGAGCPASQLTLSLGPVQGAAGTEYQPLRLRNRGPACTLIGYPGVSLLAADGHQIGGPAERAGPPAVPVRLPTGGTATAVLSIANAGAFPEAACRPQQASTVRVYPPGQRLALTAPDPVTACSRSSSHQLHIAPMQAGDGPAG